MLINYEKKMGYHYLRSQMGPSHIRMPPHEKEFRDEAICLMWQVRTWFDHDYFYVDIFQGNAFKVFPIETIVPEDILEKIRTDNNTFLYICNSHEAFLTIVEPLYESLVIEEGIPARKIYIANGSPDLAKAVRSYADAHNLEYMNVEWILEFEVEISLQANRHRLDGNTILTDRKYDKKYLNFNRRWRLQRPVLVALLKAKGLLDKGYVSLGKSDDDKNWEKMWHWITRRYKDDAEITDLFLKNEHDIINMPPLYIDTDDLVTNQAELNPDHKYLYESSLVSVVTETTFYQDMNNPTPERVSIDASGLVAQGSRFLSEKIFKPIAFGHPFIFMTVPKSLEALRELGYKTFHPYIDESYDNEFDDHERLKKIVKEIERICNFTDEEVREFCNNVKNICKYNQQLLKSKTILFLTGRDPEWRIMHKNFVIKTL